MSRASETGRPLSPPSRRTCHEEEKRREGQDDHAWTAEDVGQHDLDGPQKTALRIERVCEELRRGGDGVRLDEGMGDGDEPEREQTAPVDGGGLSTERPPPEVDEEPGERPEPATQRDTGADDGNRDARQLAVKVRVNHLADGAGLACEGLVSLGAAVCGESHETQEVDRTERGRMNHPATEEDGGTVHGG